jgi:hypothetical protein
MHQAIPCPAAARVPALIKAPLALLVLMQAPRLRDAT